MKKIKQNNHLNIAMILLIVCSSLAFIACITICIIHVRWTTNGIEITGDYKNGQVTYFTSVYKDYITVDAPYQSELLEGKKVLVYYNKNNPESCYIRDQIKLGLIFGIASLGCALGALGIHLIVRRRTTINIEIIKEGQSIICDISDIEIIEDSNNVEYAIIHATYNDPVSNQEYTFDSPKLRDKELINNPNLLGTVQVHFLKEDPTKYVVTAYQINEN